MISHSLLRLAGFWCNQSLATFATATDPHGVHLLLLMLRWTPSSHAKPRCRSTAMWIKGQPGSKAGEPGIVTNPGEGERLLFNGVFIGILS